MMTLITSRLAATCIVLLAILASPASAGAFRDDEIVDWEERAKRVTIIRDKWGIPHVYGNSDADAVFGLMYAQCEDDFRRVEMNYVEKLGRMAELKGEGWLAQDLMMRLLIDSSAAEKDYRNAPAWLKELLEAHAAGINYYLYKHPELRPAMISRYKPWYHLLWTDGSIGAINTAGVSLREIAAAYLDGIELGFISKSPEENLSGSNGFAIGPAKSQSGRAMLYINPHVSFYFRPEVHMVSNSGLNAYGAVTWGQMFVYQGFNEHCGWMHTSGYSDNADLYIENTKEGKKPVYYYKGKKKNLLTRNIELTYIKDGKSLVRRVRTYSTHHGPLICKRNGRWISLRALNRDMNGLLQCWLRMKAKGLEDFKSTMRYYANPTNNTVFADSSGNIAYFHGNFHPKRARGIDPAKELDGTSELTEWQGVHTLEEGANIYNPAGGWLQSCNSSAFTAAGRHTPQWDSLPAYIAPDGDNFRSQTAILLLDNERKLDMKGLIDIGYSKSASAFNVLVPYLTWSFRKTRGLRDSVYLSGPIMLLNNWDFNCGINSVATTLAVEWAEKLLPAIRRANTEGFPNDNFINKTFAYAKSAESSELLDSFRSALLSLENRFGTWAVKWGDLNRLQRTAQSDTGIFSDSAASIAIPYVSSVWGMLPSLGSHYFPGTKKRYAVNGNSFVCVVEFGPRIKAKSLLAGGQSGNPASAHYFDQGQMYADGKFKDVYFYRDEVDANAERKYHPGE